MMVNLKILANTIFGHIIKGVLVRKIEASLYLGHIGFNTDEWVKKKWQIYKWTITQSSEGMKCSQLSFCEWTVSLLYRVK